MSVNPVAVGGTGASVNVEQLIAAELSMLAAEAQALQGQLTAGQVVTAQVLPSNGLTDLISILGSRVAAALPPGLQPGDLFAAQVTGFDGTQILLQLLNSEPGQLTPSLPSPGTATAEPPPGEPPSALAAAATRPVLPEGVSPSMAPPPAVFVAASVRPAPMSAAALPAPGAPVVTPSPPAQALQPPVTVLADIEARLAAARAGSIGVTAPSSGVTVPAPALSPNATAVAPPPPPLSARFVLPPTIVPSARFGDVAAAPGGDLPVPARNATPAAPPVLTVYRNPTALVRALGLPVTPTNVAAARLAIDTPQRLPAALATLESALPQLDDPRVATLRTLTAFLGKIEPGSPQLPAQISAFVDNVVTGNEPKLVQLLAAQLTAEQPASAAAAPAPAPAGVEARTPLPVVALAQIAERGAALSVDLKTQILALINAPPLGAEGADDLVPAASSALSAITAVQMNAAQALNAAPQTMAFTLPLWLGSGYAQARVAVDRDAPETGGKRALDGDNFHIAFVLDTQHLGTVTVDLQTVGRAFSLAVKTESEPTAKRFGEAIGRLTGRLETLRYRVNSAEATVAARGSATTGAATPAALEPADDGGIPSDVNVRA